MISLENLGVDGQDSFAAARRRLDGVDLRLPAGEWVALAGPNAAGKTTLLLAIAGLVAPATGRVVFEGGERPVTSVVFQEPCHQFVASTVRGELAVSAEPRGGLPGAGRAAGRVDFAIERFGLEALLGRHPQDLSGGEQQRLALATVWVERPRILLLDEPASFLDDEAADVCRRTAGELASEGAVVVWATPGGRELDWADRLIILERGVVAYDGGVDRYAFEAHENQLAPPPAVDLAIRLGGGPLVAACRRPRAAGDGAAAAESKGGGGGRCDRLDRALEALAEAVAGGGTRGRAGRVVAPPLDDVGDESDTRAGVDPAVGAEGVVGQTDAPPDDASVAIRLRGVGFSYTGASILNGVDFDVMRGERVGVTGAIGCGKSTFLALCAGLVEGKVGRVERNSVAFLVSQNPERMFFASTVQEEMNFGLRRCGVSDGGRCKRIDSALRDVGLDPGDYLGRDPFRLSQGEMRRLSLAIALTLRPGIVLLDEPTSGMDPAGAAAVETAIASIGGAGAAIVIASHDGAFLARSCDRIVWLEGGRVSREVEIDDGRISRGSRWPTSQPIAVLLLQDRLGELGLAIEPRAASARALSRVLGRAPTSADAPEDSTAT